MLYIFTVHRLTPENPVIHGESIFVIATNKRAIRRGMDNVEDIGPRKHLSKNPGNWPAHIHEAIEEGEDIIFPYKYTRIIRIKINHYREKQKQKP